jgi:hypothetical protein
MIDTIFNYQTLEELFDRALNSDFNEFINATGGMIYEILPTKQMRMVFIQDTDDLCEFFDKEIDSIIEEGKFQRPILKATV